MGTAQQPIVAATEISNVTDFPARAESIATILLSRIILVHGSFIFSLIAYRHIVVVICVDPFALYFEIVARHGSDHGGIILLFVRQKQ
ncbi:hypothetical protein JHK87_040385 [Glycine soja]|nr:hypothetical protein JHK87_040385 [Glycine soja]